MLCGVVRFDRDDANVGGWASVNGLKPFRISSYGDLDNQTMWWTSLSWNSIYSCNLNKAKNIKRTTYLNGWQQEGQEGICSTWGIDDLRFSEDIKARVLSAFFSRTMILANQYYGMSNDQMPSQDNLADELRCLMLPYADPHLSPELDAALSSAHQYYSYCVTPKLNLNDYVLVNFQIPPVQYANKMLSGIVPTEQVRFLSDQQLPPRTERLNWALNCEYPLLVKVVVSKINPDYVNVLNFGMGAQNQRHWVSQPELLLLSQYATVDIVVAFMFSGYQELPKECQLPAFSRLQGISPTANIIASNHWISLCRENPYKLEASRAGQRAKSPRAIWLNALDRFYCLSYAIKLHNAGVIVKKFGAGTVTVLAPKYHYKTVYELATNIGLLSPPSLLPNILMQEELNHV